MLTDLTIKNVAIIDSLQLSFRSGLTVLSGETGAGKSIIIDAVGLIMGNRASSDLIRSGEEEAVVEAVFDISKLPQLKEQLAGSGFAADDELLVRRALAKSGKNRVYINGSMATLMQLAEITSSLINIYGQHDSQTLLKPENHLRLLDDYAANGLLRSRYGRAFDSLAAVRDQLDSLRRSTEAAEKRIDLLSYQSDEIARASIDIEKDSALEEQRSLLANSGRLAEVSTAAFERLYSGDGALLGQLKRVLSSISEIASIDPSLSEVSAAIEEGYLQLEDVAITLRDYSSRIEANPAALQQLEDRLHLLGGLKKKYGPSLADILLYKVAIDTELGQLETLSSNISALDADRQRLEDELRQSGEMLTASRCEAAVKLRGALEAEAAELAMKGAVIAPTIEKLAEPRSNGYERVEFLFSPNPGETPRPLGKIASGGELSRLMLAIKQVLPDSEVPTVVFDEVDTGIGGVTSELVGQKLKSVAVRQQVLCITHLPQVAVFADQQLRVEKLVANGRSMTRVIELDRNQRTGEIARMLGGKSVSDSALRHAAEMLAISAAYRPAAPTSLHKS